MWLKDDDVTTMMSWEFTTFSKQVAGKCGWQVIMRQQWWEFMALSRQVVVKCGWQVMMTMIMCWELMMWLKDDDVTTMMSWEFTTFSRQVVGKCGWQVMMRQQWWAESLWPFQDRLLVNVADRWWWQWSCAESLCVNVGERWWFDNNDVLRVYGPFKTGCW